MLESCRFWYEGRAFPVPSRARWKGRKAGWSSRCLAAAGPCGCASFPASQGTVSFGTGLADVLGPPASPVCRARSRCVRRLSRLLEEKSRQFSKGVEGWRHAGTDLIRRLQEARCRGFSPCPPPARIRGRNKCAAPRFVALQGRGGAQEAMPCARSFTAASSEVKTSINSFHFLSIASPRTVITINGVCFLKNNIRTFRSRLKKPSQGRRWLRRLVSVTGLRRCDGPEMDGPAE